MQAELLKTVLIEHPDAGVHKFEIYKRNDAFFFADIWRKTSDGIWRLEWDEYSFKKALSLDDALKSCETFILNKGK